MRGLCPAVAPAVAGGLPTLVTGAVAGTDAVVPDDDEHAESRAVAATAAVGIRRKVLMRHYTQQHR